MPNFYSILKGGALLGIASTLITVSATPANAQSACTDRSGNLVIGTGFSCTIGDKLYSNFSGTGAIAASETTFQWAILTGEVYNLSVQGVFDPGVYTLTYDVTIQDPAFEFDRLRTSATSSDINTAIWEKSLAAVPPTAPSPLIATDTSAQGQSVVGIFPAGVSPGPVSFTSVLTVEENSVTQFQDSLTQRPGSRSVPGPLPIIGASVAFGFSRKLRSRIKVVA